MDKLKLVLLAGAAIAGSVVMTEAANAQTSLLYGAGSTLASKVYRQLFDCWGAPINAIVPGCVNGEGNPPGYEGGVNVQILYAPVGSGAGKTTFVTHATINLTVPVASNIVPYSSRAFLPASLYYPYLNFHFAGSEAVLLPSDIATYNSTGLQVVAGLNPIQIPAFATAVAVAFNGTDGNGAPLNIVHAIPLIKDDSGNLYPGSSGLNLSRQALCGIFSGYIAQWDHPILTALNGGTALGHGPITVVHRADQSGTNFLMTNALVAQCAQIWGPSSAAPSAAPVLYALNYTDALIPPAQCPDGVPVEGSDLVNWPDVGSDQCGNAISGPAGSSYISAGGSSGVAQLIKATNGAIGYLSPDFAAPIVGNGPYGAPYGFNGSTDTRPGTALPAANLQSQYDIDNNTGQFQPPTSFGAAQAMSSTIPVDPANDPVAGVNPISWGRQGLVSNPAVVKSYPISGFSWFEFYQCYNAADQSAESIIEYLYFHYGNNGTPDAQNILIANGFAPVPAEWNAAIFNLIMNSSSAISDGYTGACPTNAGL